MALAETLDQIRHVATTSTGTGLLPPFLKATQHLIYLTGMLAADEITVTQEQAYREIDDAIAHWGARSNDIQAHISTRTAALLTTLDQILIEVRAEYAGWDTTTAIRNLIAVCNRFYVAAAALDRELTGITSDPGSTM